jgi:radical SAM superfamily enzyme YgiQ (UPF0313 family)
VGVLNIAWLSVNASYSHSSLALPLLHASCRDIPDANWIQVETTIHDKPNKVVDRLLNYSPDVVLGTGYLFTIEFTLDVCARFKALSPNTLLILGGPEFLGPNETFLREHPYVDAVVRGEGEYVLPDLLESIKDKSAWSRIPGVSFRRPDGEIHEDRLFAEPPMEADIPDPMDSEFYDFKKAFVQIETSRGCASVCCFCTSALTSGMRTVPIDRVRKQLDLALEKNIGYVRLLDRTFNTPADRAEKLLELFTREYSSLEFHLELYPNLLNDRMVELCTKSRPGQLHLEIGLQSTDPDILRACRRAPFTQKAQHYLSTLCEATNLRTHVDLIIGLPLQTYPSFTNDLQLLSKFGPTILQIETLKILKGTPLTSHEDIESIIHAANPPYDVLKTEHMSFSEINIAMEIAKIVDDFYNHPELHDITQKAWRLDPGFFEKLHGTLAESGEDYMSVALERRYRLLHRYLSESDPMLKDELETMWIKKGHNPLKGPGICSLFKAPIPDKAKCLLSSATHPRWRDARTYLLEQSEGKRWLRVYRENQSQTEVLGEWFQKK